MRANELSGLRDTLGGGKVLDGPRSRRAAATTSQRTMGRRSEKPRYAEYGESDLEDEDEEADEHADQEESKTSILEGLAEPEGGTDEEEDDDDDDVDMEDAAPSPEPLPSRKPIPAPKPPKITLKAPSKTDPMSSKPRLIVTPASVPPQKSVEDQEMEDDPGDEEVEDSSGLSGEEAEEDGEEDEENDELNDEEQGQEGVDLGGQQKKIKKEEDDEDSDSSGETPASGMATPDATKLTKRQRGRPEDQGQLMALDMAPQQRKVCSSCSYA